MTMVMRDLENKEIGREEGEQNAIAQTIINLMDSMKWSVEQTMENMKIPPEKRDLYVGPVSGK